MCAIHLIECANAAATVGVVVVGDEPSSVLTAWTGTLLRALAHHGVDTAALLTVVGIDASVLADPEQRIPLAASTRLWDAAVEITGDDAFGIEVSRFTTAGSFHGLGQAFMSSPTLRAALERVARFSRVTADMASTSIHVEGDEFVYVNGWRPGATPPADISMVATMAAVVRAPWTMHGRDLAPTRVEVKHRRPRNCGSLRGLLPCPLRFDAPEFRLAFRLADVERPAPGGHHRLAAAADAAVLDYLDTLRIDNHGGAVTRQVRDVLADAIAAGEPDVAAIASELAISSRTLQRRLSDEGTTFRDVLADTRRDLAMALLRDPERSVTAIGRRLGFSETAAFTRAFRRWTGGSPTAWRRSQPAARPRSPRQAPASPSGP